MELFCRLIVCVLAVSAVVHLLAPTLTERWLSNPRVVRGVGTLLLVLSAPCLAWPGWYFRALFAGLAISGVWRLWFPQSSIRAQQWSYPRRVHGWLLLAAAVLVWAFHP